MTMGEQWPEVTLDTPIEELKEIHKRIWDECIIEHKGYCKPKTPYKNSCVACEVAYLRVVKMKFYGKSMCDMCPMFKEDYCVGLNSLYDRWYYEFENYEKRIEYAKKIRDYKWREETK